MNNMMVLLQPPCACVYLKATGGHPTEDPHRSLRQDHWRKGDNLATFLHFAIMVTSSL